MFNRLLRGPRPWRYGSLYLPEGSKNLGSPEYALEPGTKVGAGVLAACLPGWPGLAGWLAGERLEASWRERGEGRTQQAGRRAEG